MWTGISDWRYSRRRTWRRARRRATGDVIRQSRRPLFEELEERVMLSVAQDLSNSIAPYQQALTTALSTANQLPLVGQQLTGLSEFTTILQNTESSIAAQTQNIVNNGHYQITVGLPALAKTFSFNLGLDSFLQATATGNVAASINPTLYVGFDYNNGAVSLDLAQTHFDIGFGISLPGFQGTFSFNHLLYTKAVDTGTNFNGVLGFNFAAGGALNPQFSGNAHVLMGLSLSFVDPALDVSFNPVFRTTLDMNWGFGANNQLNTPSIQLVDMGLEADSFLDNFLGDVIQTVQKFTKPIQPFIDIFQTPVPILSAFGSSETIGTLILKGAGSSQAQQDSFTLMVQIINAVNSIDFSSGTGGAVIPFGTLTVTGNPQQAGAFGFNTGLVGGAIDDILDTPALQSVEDTLTTLGNYAGGAATAGFKFPLLENPGPVIAGILLGQADTSLFYFTTGRQHFELAPSLGVGIKDLFGIFLTAGVVFDANLTMGYDTAGLIALAQDPGHDASHLLHGFYFDNSIDPTVPPQLNAPPIRQTGLYLQGLMELSASAIVTISGGLYANVSVELVNTDSSNHVHLDTMIGNLTSGGKVFDLSGKLYASADISLELSLPVGPDITLFSFNLAYAELLNFDPPPPPDFGVPVTVIDVVDQHTLLLDANKMAAGNRRVTVQPFHNLSLSVGGNTVDADGIRVDYPGEIYFFIERKNDLTSNYYNFIGLNDTPPDGVTVNVIDPFRVFLDEGAANPSPAQTKPTVMLVGGKDVNYTYSEGGDGTNPNVFLVGGYGLNTLIGGTMEFGNFIPSSRVAQAHAYFADRSGFDGMGQNLINAQIANAVSPSTPSGVIGATMYARHGGLMMGGAGNNSFYALGAGTYEMVGGEWVNSFNISPSFGGAPATYQIDGGPGGDALLVVKVPAGDVADFENGTVPDKYRPQFKALDVFSNAGLFTTAHGITSVLAVGAPGSTMVFGDTSELDIEFSAAGAGALKFGGSAAPDVFDVTAQYNVEGYNAFGTKYHRNTALLYPYNDLGERVGIEDATLIPPGWVAPAGSNFQIASYDLYIFDGPVYTVTRTFGTNNRTQSIRMNVGGVDDTSIVLDGRGESDQYHFATGLGTFLDITVDDSDETTQNSLVVDARQLGFLYDQATLTDDALRLEYYTPVLLVELRFGAPVDVYFTSAAYSPTIHFDDNTDITFGCAVTFQRLVVNRPTAPQRATILLDELATGDVSVGGFGRLNLAYDPDQPGATMLTFGTDWRIDVQANAGNLAVENFDLNINDVRQFTFNVYGNTGALSFKETLSFAGYYDTYNVFGNAGTLTIEEYISSSAAVAGYILGESHVVNILANDGTINLHDYLHPTLQHYPGFRDAQVNVGGTGGLANVHGTINLSHATVLLPSDPEDPIYSGFGRYGLKIDDRNGSAAPWFIDWGKTEIGDLTVNHLDISFFGKYEAFTTAGSSVTIYEFPNFVERYYNGGSFPTLSFGSIPNFRKNKNGDAVSFQLSATGNGGQTIVWAASSLPPGLAIDQSGLISGVIAPQASQLEPYPTVVTITVNEITRADSISWYVSSGVSGDYDGDSIVGQSDYGIWRSNFGKPVTSSTFGDGNSNSRVDAADYVLWRKNLASGGSQALAVSTFTDPSANSADSIAISVILAGPEAEDAADDLPVFAAKSSTIEVTSNFQDAENFAALALRDSTTTSIRFDLAYARTENRGHRLTPAARVAYHDENRTSEHDLALMKWFSPLLEPDSIDPGERSGDAEETLHTHDSVFESFKGAFAECDYKVARSDLLMSLWR